MLRDPGNNRCLKPAAITTMTLKCWWFAATAVIATAQQTSAFAFQPCLRRVEHKTQDLEREIRSTLLLAAKDDDDEFDRNRLDAQYRDRNRRWIVLVDDEESIRQAVGDFLYDEGYQVTACSDATALLEVVSLPQGEDELPVIPDVIISDIRMPGRDGLELLRYVRGNKRLERVPLVLLTAKAFTKDRVEGYNAGADVYLTKPFDPDELLAIVDNLIVRRQQMIGTKGGKLTDLQEDLGNIKQILKVNAAKVVKKTDVYLTPSEREVIEMVCDGLKNKEIARERGVTPERIASILQQLYLKTDTRTRTELAKWAMKTGYAPSQ